MPSPVPSMLQAGTIQTVGDLCKRHRKDFLQPNTCTEAERDRIEAEIGQYIKACTTNIARLDGGVQQGKSGGGEVNASTAAHCHGVVRNHKGLPLCVVAASLCARLRGIWYGGWPSA